MAALRQLPSALHAVVSAGFEETAPNSDHGFIWCVLANFLQVDTVLEGCAFFLERSAYHVIQPTQLSSHLQAAGMMQAHARAFSGVWEAEANGVSARPSLIHPQTL